MCKGRKGPGQAQLDVGFSFGDPDLHLMSKQTFPLSSGHLQMFPSLRPMKCFGLLLLTCLHFRGKGVSTGGCLVGPVACSGSERSREYVRSLSFVSRFESCKVSLCMSNAQVSEEVSSLGYCIPMVADIVSHCRTALASFDRPLAACFAGSVREVVPVSWLYREGLLLSPP